MSIFTEQQINPAKLTEARESKGLSMADLARLIDITRQAISAFEKGTKQPSFETLSRIAKILEFPIHFFTNSKDSSNIDGVVFFRSRSTTAKKERMIGKIKAKWVASVLNELTQHADIPQANIPNLMSKDFHQLCDEDIEEIASQTRRFFGLKDGPIKNLTTLLENNGIVMSHIHTTSKVDAFSCFSENRPIIVFDCKQSLARTRFSIAHELGHLVLHQSVTEDDISNKEMFNLIEDQANYFASCFLLPANTFSQEFFSVKLSALLALKERWKVSVAAIILRLSHLELISENQKLYLYKQIATYRKKEPLDDVLPRELPMLLNTLLNVLEDHNITTKEELHNSMGIPIIDLATILRASIDDFKSKYENNIIQFTLSSTA